MGNVRLAVAVMVSMIWLAGIILVVCDRARGVRPPPVAEPVPEPPSPVEPVSLAGWKRVLLAPSALVVGLPIFLVLIVLFAPLLAVQFGYFAHHWTRFKLFGIPMPRIELPGDA